MVRPRTVRMLKRSNKMRRPWDFEPWPRTASHLPPATRHRRWLASQRPSGPMRLRPVRMLSRWGLAHQRLRPIQLPWAPTQWRPIPIRYQSVRPTTRVESSTLQQALRRPTPSTSVSSTPCAVPFRPCSAEPMLVSLRRWLCRAWCLASRAEQSWLRVQPLTVDIVPWPQASPIEQAMGTGCSIWLDR